MLCAPAWGHPSIFIALHSMEALPYDPAKQGSLTGVSRFLEPLTFAVPLPNDTNAFETTQALLAGPTDVQFTVLKRWPTRRIHWLLIDTRVSLKANQKAEDIFLASGISSFKPDMAKEEGDAIKIDTGAAQFWVRKKGFNLLDRVVIDGKQLLSPGASPGVELTAQDGTLYRMALDPNASVVIERNGPVRVVVRATGTHVSNAGKDLLDSTVRMHFYKGKQRVRVVYSLRNASKRRLENVVFNSLELSLKAAFSSASFRARHDSGETQGQLAASESIQLFQGISSLHLIRDPGLDAKFWPTGIQGYTLEKGAAILKQGQQPVALFYSQALESDAGRAITIGTRFAASLWPQGLSVSHDGHLRIGAFPKANDKSYAIRFGTHITREHVFFFEAKAGASPRDEFFRFQYPLVAKPQDPDWYNQDEMFLFRLMSFKNEASFSKDKGWPYDNEPHSTNKRRPSFSIPQFIDWRSDPLHRRIAPGYIDALNFLRQQELFGSGYYLSAEQRMSYHADRSIPRSDDFDWARARDQVPGLRDGKGGLKDFRQLPNADRFPAIPVAFTPEQQHGYAVGFWSYLSGESRFAEAYADWGEWVRLQKDRGPTARALAWSLYNLVDLYANTGQAEYQLLAWKLLQTEFLDKSAVAGKSGGTDWQRGAFIGPLQAQKPKRELSTFVQGRLLVGAYAYFHDHAAKDERQKEASRDLMLGISRFVQRELWVKKTDAPGEYGFVARYPYDERPSLDALLKSPSWQGGVQDVFMALYFGYIAANEIGFLQSGEAMLRAAAYNPAQARWFQDLESRQMVQFLAENTVLYKVWRWLPIQASMLTGGRYHIMWIAPYGARHYWIKYSTKKIVEDLEFDRDARSFKYDPKEHVTFYAATNLRGEPQPIDPGFYQALIVKGLEPGKKYYFAARYYTSDPRPPITKPSEEATPGDAGVIHAEKGPELTPEPLTDAGQPENSTADTCTTDCQDRRDGPMPPVGCQCQGCQSSAGGDLGLWLCALLLLVGWRRRRGIEGKVSRGQ